MGVGVRGITLEMPEVQLVWLQGWVRTGDAGTILAAASG